MKGIYDFTETINGWYKIKENMQVNEVVLVIHKKEEVNVEEPVIEFKKKQGFEYDKVKDEILRESIENIRQLIVPVSDINGIIDYTNPIADNLEMD